VNYNDLTWRHFMSASHAGTLMDVSADMDMGAGTRMGEGVWRGAAGSRAQGTWVQFDLQIGVQSATPGVARIQAARFLAYGCPHVIAVADWLAGHSIGLEVELAPVSAVATASAASAPAMVSLRPTPLPRSVAALQREFEVPVEKLGRVLTIEDAWRAALSSPYRTERV
jgi:hypothetical protein